MSNFPGTKHELLRANYRQTSASAICKGCGAPIEWWKTTNGKSIPMNLMAEDHAIATAHWATCPNSKDFKGGDATKELPPAKGSGALTPTEVERMVRALRDRLGARVVVAVDEFGTYAAYGYGIPAEDLRHDLISAGNFVRTEISKKEGTPA